MSLPKLLEPIAAYFRLPSAESLALRELEEAKRKLLDAQTGREYAESMCRYHEARVKRLTAYIHNATEMK
jgi:hypothetical protein